MFAMVPAHQDLQPVLAFDYAVIIWRVKPFMAKFEQPGFTMFAESLEHVTLRN